MTTIQLPHIVSPAEWRDAQRALLEKEKAATRARDALAAERRRLPMTEIPAGSAFDGPGGRRNLLELFEGRRQLIVYHFMFRPGGTPCSGCSMFTDQVPQLAHLHARDTTFALVSPASQAEIAPFKARMGWDDLPWYSTVGDGFQAACGTDGGGFALQVLVRDGDRAFLTYESRGRGVEALGSVWTFLDLTPLGRQEDWEDTPPGRPQGPPYEWWQYHDDYDDEPRGAAA
jgi:predicted dithiol-disulfide oxidoreductase (DUF899 family)